MTRASLTRLRLLLRGVLLLLTVFHATGCGPSRDPDAPPATSATRPSIVLISIDTLRADHLPAWGYSAGRTPAIDRLARDGLLFEQAWSQVPLTLPSHASIFTGRFPDRLGVRGNLGYSLPQEDLPVLAASFRDAGWRTGGAVSAYVLRSETGISRGFDHWNETMETQHDQSIGGLQRSGASSWEAARSWLEEESLEDPFFLFLHLYEPHSPWDAPPEVARGLPTLYDADVALADRVVDKVLAWLEERDLYESSLVVLLSDHGEGLGDHGEMEHGVLLYREALHVPLLLKLPGGLRAGERVTEPVALIDVAPTLLEIADLEVPAGMEGRSLLAPQDKKRAIYSETFYPRIHYGWSHLTSLVEGSLHFVHGPEPELFDLDEDPGETVNVLQERRGAVLRFREVLEGHDTALQGPAEVDAETRQRLAALGYAGSVATISENLPDPRTKIPILDRLREAATILAEGRCEEAVPRLEALLAEDPGLADAWPQLARCLVSLGRTEAAIEAYRAALANTSGAPATAFPLALLLFEEGRTDEAEEHARLALGVDPGKSRDLLSRIAFQRGDLDDAISLAREAVDVDPERPPLRVTLARTLAAAGLTDDALDVALEAEKRLGPLQLSQPQNIRGLFFLLGRLQAEKGLPEPAEAAFRRHLELFPDSLAGWSELAILVAVAGRPEESGPLLQRMTEVNPTPAAYAEAVETLRVLGDERAASGLLRHARSLFPDAVELAAPPAS